MKFFFAVCALWFLTSCATKTRIAAGLPATAPLHSASDISGSYLNRGLVHSPDENHALEAYLDVALGLTQFPDAQGGVTVIRAEKQKVVVIRMDGARVLREISLEKDRDYRVTDEGLEFTRHSEGPGGEGVFSMKIASRLLLCPRGDGSLVLKLHEDIHAIALWPYRDSRDLWYEFQKSG